MLRNQPRQTTIDQWSESKATPKKEQKSKPEAQPCFSPVERQTGVRTYSKRPDRPLRSAPPPSPSPVKTPSQPPSPPLIQLHLDLGQRGFGPVTCKDCGMIYTPGEVSDMKLHKSFHAKTLKNAVSSDARDQPVVIFSRADKDPAATDLSITILRDELVSSDDEILAIPLPLFPRPTSSSSSSSSFGSFWSSVSASGSMVPSTTQSATPEEWWQVVKQLSDAFATTKVEAELCEAVQAGSYKHLLFYVDWKKRVVAACIGEVNTNLSRRRGATTTRGDDTHGDDNRAVVRYLWTHPDFRRLGYATSLLHATRRHLQAALQQQQHGELLDFELLGLASKSEEAALFEKAYRSSLSIVAQADAGAAEPPSSKKARTHSSQ